MQARSYRPEIAEFLSPDHYESAAADETLMSGELTTSRFMFAGANPVDNIEFDGHRTPDDRQANAPGTNTDGSVNNQRTYDRGQKAQDDVQRETAKGYARQARAQQVSDSMPSPTGTSTETVPQTLDTIRRREPGKAAKSIDEGLKVVAGEVFGDNPVEIATNFFAPIRVARAVRQGGRAIQNGVQAIRQRRATKGADSTVNLASDARTTHILRGDRTGGGHLWPGRPGKTPFPRTWDADRVMTEISDVATDPAATVVGRQGERTVLEGTRDGVDIRVVTNGRDIITGYPTNLPRNPR